MLARKGGPTVLDRNPTASFLTATTSIYAIGAGITAAAGTRLALHMILMLILIIPITRHGFPCIVVSCHYLPVSGLGNLRACYLP